jgi:hypothetical protein
MLFRKFAAVIAAIAVASGTLMAQTAGSTLPRVRLTLAGKHISGRLTAVDVDALTLLPDGRGDALRIILSSVSAAEVSEGKRPRARADLMGVGVGFMAGTTVCVAAGNMPNPGPINLLPAIICFFGGLGGGVVSGIVAAHHFGRERWRSVPLTSLAGLAP